MLREKEISFQAEQSLEPNMHQSPPPTKNVFKRCPTTTTANNTLATIPTSTISCAASTLSLAADLLPLETQHEEEAYQHQLYINMPAE